MKCRDCFRTDDSPRDDRRPSYGDRSERPAYVSRPHSDDRRPSADTRSSGDIETRLRSIERKLDNILELLDADDVE